MTGRPPSVTRLDPPYVATEREMLDAWLDRDTADAAADLVTLKAEMAPCRALIAGHDLDESQPDSRGGTFSLRWIYVHMIEEYARHNGHADLLRERIDGVTGD